MKSIFPDYFGRLIVGDNFLFRKENEVSYYAQKKSQKKIYWGT